MNNILSLQNLSFSYNADQDTEKILDNVSYQFHEQTLYSIMAPSGTGKTTLISMLAGLEEPTQGEILFNNTNISDAIGLNMYRRKYSAIIFQGYNLIPYMTALQNILTALTIQSDNKHISKKRKKRKSNSFA